MKMLLIIGLLAGCTTAEYVMTPDGDDGIAITCFRNIKNCYYEAQQQCPSGYTVLDKTIGEKGTILIACKD